MGDPYSRMMTGLILEAEEGINNDDDEAVISYLSEGVSDTFDIDNDEEDDDELYDILDDEEEP